MNGSGCLQQQHSVVIPVPLGGGDGGGGGGVIHRTSTSSTTQGEDGIMTSLTLSSTTVASGGSSLEVFKTSGTTASTGRNIAAAGAALLPQLMVPVDSIQVLPIPKHTCEICRAPFNSQFHFFEHLKAHYENVPSTSSAAAAAENGTKQRKPSSKKKEGSGGGTVEGTSASAQSDLSRRESSLDTALVTKKLKESLQNIMQDIKQPRASKASSHVTPSVKTKKPSSSEMTCPNCKKSFRKEKNFQLHIACCQNFLTGQKEENQESLTINGSKVQVEESCNFNVLNKPSGQTDSLNEGVMGIREEIVQLDPSAEIPDDDFDYDTCLVPDNDLVEDDEEETEMMYRQSNICPSCDEHCETKENLDKHMAQKHPEILLLDNILNTPGKKKRNSADPVTAAAPSKKSDVLRCQQCHRIFNHRNSLVYHMRSHTGERPYKCDSCEKRFFATSALKVHKRLHSGEKPYACEECGRNFRQWGDLKYHKISIHSDERAFQCEFCGKDFARKYSLIVHRRIHTGEKNYKCTVCSKSFRAASYLQNHARIHTGEKPHECTICGKPFRVRSDMKRHLASHTREMNKLSASMANALAVAAVPTSLHAEADAKFIPVISTPNETTILQATTANFSLQQQQQLPVITTGSVPSEILPKLLEESNSSEYKTEPSEQICLPIPISVVNHQTQTQLITSGGSSAQFNVPLADGDGVHTATDILTLYQDTGQMDIFAADGSRSGTVVLVPLGHTFIQE